MKKRYTNGEIKARLILIVGVGLTISFLMIVGVVLYSLAFITQPLDKQAPNDKAFIDGVLVPIVLFLSGTLAGVLAANGLKDESATKETSNSRRQDDSLF